MAEEKDIREFHIESPSGRFRATAPADSTLEHVAEAFIVETTGEKRRVAVDVIDSAQESWRRLDGSKTLHDAGLEDGDTLRIAPEAVAGCFTGGTRILMADGSAKNIEKVAVGDQILSAEPLSQKLSATTVTNVFRGQTSEYLIINEQLEVTGSHPIWSDGWTRAEDLVVGHRLWKKNGDAEKIETIRRRFVATGIYNLEVSSREHTFFAETFLVHNMESKIALFPAEFGVGLRHRRSRRTLGPSEGYLEVRSPFADRVTVDDFFLPLYERVCAIEIIYSIFMLLASGKRKALDWIHDIARERRDDSRLSASALRRVLAMAGVEPLRIDSVAYGSDASVDLLGFGKVLTVIKEMIEEIVWRSEHKKNMALLEEKEKQADIERKQTDNEERSVEVIAKKIEVIKSLGNVELSTEEVDALVSAILLPSRDLLAQPIGLAAGEEVQQVQQLEGAHEDESNVALADFRFEREA